ncbi:hypothetical protein MXB_3034 [Myxobolus squamalis]|nr:hypothetical protein MXB_3034 [Myxobolus squamalis]
MSIILSLLIFTFKTSIHLRVQQPSPTKEWEDYKSKYNLEFSVDEDFDRRETFFKNCQFIMNSNSRNLNFTLKMNGFGHLVYLKILIFRTKLKG